MSPWFQKPAVVVMLSVLVLCGCSGSPPSDQPDPLIDPPLGYARLVHGHEDRLRQNQGPAVHLRDRDCRVFP